MAKTHTWATNSTPTARLRDTARSNAPLLALVRRLTTVAIPPKTAHMQNAYVLLGLHNACNPPDILLQSFFNVYVLSENAVPQGLYCSLYSQTWDRSYGTNYGQYRGSDRYTVSQSYSYSLDTTQTWYEGIMNFLRSILTK